MHHDLLLSQVPEQEAGFKSVSWDLNWHPSRGGRCLRMRLNQLCHSSDPWGKKTISVLLFKEKKLNPQSIVETQNLKVGLMPAAFKPEYMPLTF